MIKRSIFKKHVHNRLKEQLRGLIRLETCREIKKFYAPWRFLEVIMDCSQQSLNQVSIFFICYTQFIFYFTSIAPCFYRNAIKLYIAFRKLS